LGVLDLKDPGLARGLFVGPPQVGAFFVLAAHGITRLLTVSRITSILIELIS
jgi:hypothetical protein